MTDLQRELLAIVKQALDPRWWVLALLAWATRDLVLADKLSGDAWAVMLTMAGSVLGVVVATASPTVREIARKVLQ